MYPLIRFPTRNDQTSSVFPTKDAGFSRRKRLISSQIWYDFLYVAASDPGSPEAIDQNEEPPGHQGAPDRDESGDTEWSEINMDELWFTKLDHDDHDSW